jgi:hypothetical protein
MQFRVYSSPIDLVITGLLLNCYMYVHLCYKRERERDKTKKYYSTHTNEKKGSTESKGGQISTAWLVAVRPLGLISSQHPSMSLQPR